MADKSTKNSTAKPSEKSAASTKPAATKPATANSANAAKPAATVKPANTSTPKTSGIAGSAAGKQTTAAATASGKAVHKINATATKPTATVKSATTNSASAAKPAATAKPANTSAPKTSGIAGSAANKQTPAAAKTAATKPTATVKPTETVRTAAATQTATPTKSAQKTEKTSAAKPEKSKKEKLDGGKSEAVAVAKKPFGIKAIIITAVSLVLVVAIILGSVLGAKSCRRPNDIADPDDGINTGDNSGNTGNTGGDNGYIAPDLNPGFVTDVNHEYTPPDFGYGDIEDTEEFVMPDLASMANVLSTAYTQSAIMPYYAEWLDTNYPRPQNVPEGNEGLEKYPVFGTLFNGESAALKQAVFNENLKLTSGATSFYGDADMDDWPFYNMMDENGNLLKNGAETGMCLYKHTAANGNYFGDVSDDEPAVVKHFIMNGKTYGTIVTGLYAPAGEVVKVEMPASSLRDRNIYISVGQITGSGRANVIGAGTSKKFVRMPIISNRFVMNKSTSFYDEETDTYACYVGSHLGGPIYMMLTNSASKSDTSEFDITVSGAVNYRHYIHGVTTEEEFEYVSKSSAPYFDMEVSWMHGVRHSGPLKYASMYDYEQLKNVAVLWENFGLVSNQFDNWCQTYGNIVYTYDDYVTAGAAVAITAHRTVDAPYSWLTNALNYEYFVTNGSWGNAHEYNHHYQKFGFSGDSNEISNNAINILEYALFTKVSSLRTLDGGLSGHNADTMPQYGLKYIVDANNAADEKGANRALQTSVHTYAAILHNIGAEAFIAAGHKTANAEGYYKHLCDAAHLDMTYFFNEVLNIPTAEAGGSSSISQASVNAVKEKNYPVFVPVNTVYQVGRVWEKDGVKQYCRTAQPFIYGTGDYTLDFENYLVIPKGFSYRIKNITQPANGSVEKTDDKHLSFKPNDEKISGEFFVTLEVTKDDGAFTVEDVTLIINLEQANILQRTTWSYTEDNKPQVNSVDDLISVYEGLKSTDANAEIGNNVNAAQNANTEIWGAYAYSPNSIMEVKGSLHINADGKYRIALRGRRYAALYLSYDGGNTYTDVIKLTYHDSGTDFMPNDYVDVELKNGDWVDFKAVLYVDYQWAYIGVGIGMFGADADGETVSETVTISYASAYKDKSYLPELFVASPYHNIFDSYAYTYSDTYSAGQTLVDSKNAESVTENSSFTHVNTNDRLLANLFDEDENNVFWSSGNKAYSADNPFEITVDLGKTVYANTFTIYYPTESAFSAYYPTAYKLYAGETLDSMALVYQTQDGGKSNNATVINLDSIISLRYYKLEISDAAKRTDKCFALRKLEWSYTVTGQVIAHDAKANDYYEYDVVRTRDAVAYSGNWKTVSSVSTFGTIYEGSSTSGASFVFEGTQIAVQSYCGSEFGSYEIYIDDELVYTADLSDGDGVKLVYISGLLESGKHTITIKGKSGKINLDTFVLFG